MDTMNVIEQDKLIKTISSLISSSNAFNSLTEWIENNERAKALYRKAREECWRDQCYSATTIIIVMIEQLMEDCENR